MLPLEALSTDILIVSEHWMSKSRIQSCNINSFKLANSFSRENCSHHGGVAIYVKEHISYKVSSFAESVSVAKIIECCAIELSDFNLIVLGLYRPPHVDCVNLNIFFETLDLILSHYSQVRNKSLIVLGDFNIHFEKDDDRSLKYLLDILNSYNMAYLIKQPTRITSCLDNILVSNDHII